MQVKIILLTCCKLIFFLLPSLPHSLLPPPFSLSFSPSSLPPFPLYTHPLSFLLHSLFICPSLPLPPPLPSDGVVRSGTFLCIHSQLERLKTEGTVDVFQAIRSARIQRPGVVPNTVRIFLYIEPSIADSLSLRITSSVTKCWLIMLRRWRLTTILRLSCNTELMELYCMSYTEH